MEIKRVKKMSRKDKDGNIVYLYAWKDFCVFEKDINENSELFEFRGDVLCLKEPVEDYFKFNIKDEKDEFIIITPLKKIKKDEVKEPETAYKPTIHVEKKSVKQDLRKEELIAEQDLINQLFLGKKWIKDKSRSKGQTQETPLKELQKQEPEKPKTDEYNKLAFINGLLPQLKRFDEKTKDKVIALVRKELEKIPDMESRIMEELEVIKKSIINDSLTREKKKNQENKKMEIDLSKHKPIDVTKFLDLFRESDGIKFLTHGTDNFNREEYLQIAKKEYDSIKNKYYLPFWLRQKFEFFAFGIVKKIGKKEYKAFFLDNKPYKLNWKSPEIIKWCSQNPGMHPLNNSIFEKEMIIPFQKSYKITEPELELIIKKKLAENLGSEFSLFNIELKYLDKASFYTDVDSLQAGIACLFRSIKQRSDKSNTLRLLFERKGRQRFIKIIHLNSKCDKPLDKMKLFGGDFYEVEKRFFGICDWSIIAENPDESVNKLNILFDISKNIKVKEKITEPIEGFTHVLTFYS